jgi:hypothetical protein
MIHSFILVPQTNYGHLPAALRVPVGLGYLSLVQQLLCNSIWFYDHVR